MKIGERDAAKKNGDFKKADRIRGELLTKYGIELIDGIDGVTKWIFA